MTDLIEKLGEAALGSRLRRLAERLSADATQIYHHYQVDIEPGWFPVVFVLSELGQASTTTLARHTGHSHVAVSKVIKHMRARGLVQVAPCKQDKRSTLISLNDRARAMLPALEVQTRDVGNAMQLLTSAIHPQFMHHINRLESALLQQPLSQRSADSARRFHPHGVQIIPFSQIHGPAFLTLNKQWIEEFFVMEASDYASLENPAGIINQGGCILLARLNQAIVGTCALINMGKGRYELAKMAVSPTCQGKGIGFMLGQATVQAARDKGASQVYLESNRRLDAAISLYKKLGFTEVQADPSPYARCDIQMALALT